MKRSSAVHLLTGLLAIVLCSPAARADSIGVTLTKTTQTGAAGTTVTFEATLTNLTGSTVFLSGDGATTSTSFLTVDDNPFLNNAPLSLGAGATTSPFAIFDVLIAPGTLEGTYGPNTFTILGGADGSTFDLLGSAQFGVTVSPVPEPGTITLLATGMLGLGVWSRSRRRTTPRI